MSKPKVMVALRDSVSVESLMVLASELAQGMGADLVALHVVEVPLLTPLDVMDESLDRHGHEVLAQAKHLAEEHSMTISTELMRAREADEAIVGVAGEKGVDLLVIGQRKPRAHALGEPVLGRVGRYAVHHAPCRVIIQIPAPDRK
jgi:nucleotide-binding universal stress UspA family protein